MQPMVLDLPFPFDRCLSVNTASKLYDINRRTLRQWIADGTLPSFKIVGLRRIRQSELVALIREKEKPAEIAGKILRIGALRIRM